MKVQENDFNFLKKVVGLFEEVLVKEKDEGSNIIVADEHSGYIVNSTQKKSPFSKNGNFGLKNIKSFLKAVKDYGEIEETDMDLTFCTDKKKFTFKKLGQETVAEITPRPIDTKGYITIGLTKEELDEMKEGLKNNISNYVSLIVEGKEFKFKIGGKISYENIYEQKIKELTRKETSTITFLTSLSYMNRFLNTLDEGSKVAILLKQGSPMIGLEANEFSTTKTFIGEATEDEFSTQPSEE